MEFKLKLTFIRKRLVEKGFVSFEEEVQLLDLVFTKHPKTGDAWAHRRWLLDRKMPQLESSSHVVQMELDACTHASIKYPNNYYSWTHRMWLLKQLGVEEVTWMLQVGIYNC